MTFTKKIIFISILLYLQCSCLISPPSNLNKATSKGLEFIQTQQDSVGSWPTFKSSSRHFNKNSGLSRLFPTSLIMNMLKTSTFKQSINFKNGIKYITNKKTIDGLWADDETYHDKQLANSQKICEVPPDTDNIALARLLIGFIDKSHKQNTLIAFEKVKKNTGLFSTFLIHLSPNSCPADNANSPSLGVNINILNLFTKHKIESDLSKDIIKQIQTSEYWKKDIYYELPMIAFWTAYSVENNDDNPELASIFQHIFSDLEKYYKNTQLDTLSDLELAIYLKVLSQMHLLGAQQSSSKLALLTNMLIERQKDNGQWQIAAIYKSNFTYKEFKHAFAPLFKKRDPNFVFPSEKDLNFIGVGQTFYGSPSEVTAICINALLTFQKTIN